ncbi:hypothetical protein HJC23_011509 [Cyclotella cryptica]|uniref:Uncharacterized protein n=1 Tax=Cyclotella cryptica TaxID=29204 RepID=A0ABD3PTJ7_9STRA|eukprot:CCRYP_011298-RA/>CCRYP_011298-RA protein AED:0.16 eAED:0.16 QI:0/-1/0/1/-1/1/1/0/371
MNDAEINPRIRPPSAGGLNLCHDHSRLFPPLSSIQFFSPLIATSHVRWSSSDLGNKLRWPQRVDNSVVELSFAESESSSVLNARKKNEPTAANTLFANINGIDTSGIEHYHPLNLEPNVKPGISIDNDQSIQANISIQLSNQFESPATAKMMNGAALSRAETVCSTNGNNDMFEEYYAVEKPPMTNFEAIIPFGQFENTCKNELTMSVADPIPKKRKQIEGPRKPQKRFTANLLYNRLGQLYSNNGGPLATEIMNKVLVEKQHFTNHMNKTPLTTNVARKVEALDPVTFEKRYLFESCSEAARRMNINRTKMSRTCRSGGGELGANPSLVYRYAEFSTLLDPQDQEHRVVHGCNAELSPIVCSPEKTSIRR